MELDSNIDNDIDSPRRLLDRIDNKCGQMTNEVIITSSACGTKIGTIPNTHYWSEGWGWLASLFLWFIIVTIFSWLIFFSLRPSWLLNPDTGELDTSKLLLASVIVGVAFIVIVWLLFCLCSGKFCYY